jgi:hypothetical protein
MSFPRNALLEEKERERRRKEEKEKEEEDSTTDKNIPPPLPLSSDISQFFNSTFVKFIFPSSFI